MTTAHAPDGALDTFPKLLDHNASARGARPAAREKMFGIWQTWSWSQLRDEARALAMGLMDLGLAPGESVVVIGKNRPKLYWSMVSTQMCGAIPVPVYADASADETAYVLEHSGAAFAVVEDQEQVDKLLAAKEINAGAATLREIVYLDARGLRKYDHAALHQMDGIEARGRAGAATLGPRIDAICAAQTGSDTCVMLYTSGTTGRSKGVVLSHDNIIKTARATVAFDKLSDADNTLAYLPMAWVGDFIFSMGQAYVAGFCVNCPEGADTMMADLKEIGPTYYFAPPRIFETLLTDVSIRMEDAGPLKKKMFDYFMGHARKVGADILDGKPVSGTDKAKYALGEFLIYGPLKNALGLSRIRVGYTAGEAVGPEIFQFYRSLGINLKQLYGQTEASVFITIQPDAEVRADTVGVPAPGVELRIAESGEIFYRSPGAFVEYYRNPEATAETKDADGWVATGDAGYIEESSGHLKIIDRAKDVGKMADGSLYAPKYVENKLKFFPAILEVVLFGDGRDTCAAMINIDMTAVGNWAERHAVSYASYQELAAHPQVYAMIQEHVEEVNAALAADPMLSGCQISRFLVLHKELDADDGEITRTRKVRRRFVAERYAALITALYDGSPSVYASVEVTYEDGRKGAINGTLEIRDARVFPATTQVAAE